MKLARICGAVKGEAIFLHYTDLKQRNSMAGLQQMYEFCAEISENVGVDLVFLFVHESTISPMTWNGFTGIVKTRSPILTIPGHAWIEQHNRHGPWQHFFFMVPFIVLAVIFERMRRAARETVDDLHSQEVVYWRRI